MKTKAWVKRPDAPARLSGRKGQQRRAQWLSSQPLCVMCEAMTPPRVTAGTDVDHIEPLAKGGADDESNFQTLCREHHQEKSIRDKGHRVRPVTGADGWVRP
ncbi:MAG: HNH endonuclease [Polaromonas sp.]|nr:HNH endonuclease [Polaromonas sp.]